MNRILLRFILIIALNIFLSGIPIFAQTYSVKNLVQSSGGGVGQSQDSTYSLKANVVGQASPVGSGSSTKFSLFAGTIFILVSNPPMIDSLSASTVLQGQNITVNVTISDDFGIPNAILSYRKGGDLAFNVITMTVLTKSFYQGIIPGVSVTSQGVEYFVTAIDIGGITVRKPDQGIISIPVFVGNLAKENAQPGGNSQTDYRLFSIPLTLDDSSAQSVLVDDLGTYDDTKWRFSEILADQTFHEFSDTSKIIPGKSYWLLVKDSDKIIDSGAGTTNRTSEEFEIPLHPQWNLFGNPFNFEIPFTNGRLKSGVIPIVREYIGFWDVPDPNQSGIPFEGYAIFIDNMEGDTLLINPDLSSQASSSAKTSNQTGDNNIQWSIRILAQCQEARDVDNIAAMASEASVEWDRFDLPEPPVIGGYVSVYFHHPEWERLSKRFCTDFRPKSEEGEIWDFEVRTNIRDRVNLTFEGIDDVPEEFEVWLVDEAAKISKNLRKSNLYSVAGRGEKNPKKLRLLVGKQDFIEEELANFQAIPTSYELNQNFPNPFNPATTIRYGLPTEDKVTLKIYNILGEEVTTLLDDENTKAGYHVVIWDGRNGADRHVASGVYIMRMSTANFAQSIKMLLIE